MSYTGTVNMGASYVKRFNVTGVTRIKCIT